jgi:hypothetical protein
MGTRGSFPRYKTPGREADSSPPSSAEVNNASSYTSIPQCPFIAWCSVKENHRDNSTFNFTFTNVHTARSIYLPTCHRFHSSSHIYVGYIQYLTITDTKLRQVEEESHQFRACSTKEILKLVSHLPVFGYRNLNKFTKLQSDFQQKKKKNSYRRIQKYKKMKDGQTNIA